MTAPNPFVPMETEMKHSSRVHEFDAKNRPEGWNVWLMLAIPLSSGKN